MSRARLRKVGPRKEQNAKSLEAKWGEAIEDGWIAIPISLVKYQASLGIDALDLNVLANLIRFWWLPNRPPFPSTEITAKEMGITEDVLIERLDSLIEREFLRKSEREDGRTAYDLTGLVKRVQATRKTMGEER